MICHVVLLKFRNSGDANNIFAKLKNLQSQIEGIVDIRCGKNCSHEGLQKGFTHGFFVDFIDAAARDAYLHHPAHQKVGAMIVAATEGGMDGIAVIDWKD